MRVKTRSVQNTTTVYIAEDGTEFENEWRCSDHERQCKAMEAEERIAGVLHFDATPPFTDDDEEWRWFYVRNQQEVDDIASAFFNSDSSAHEFHPKAFPCWIAAVFTGREDRAGWMIEYADYAGAQSIFDKRVAGEIKKITGTLAYTAGFERFWAAYPRKVKKRESFERYLTMLKIGFREENMLRAAENYAEDCREKNMEVRFIRNATSFLNLVSSGQLKGYLPLVSNGGGDTEGSAE